MANTQKRFRLEDFDWKILFRIVLVSSAEQAHLQVAEKQIRLQLLALNLQ